MTGRLIAVVGPSGVGKDSLMRALAARDATLGLVRRVITRAPDLGGEDFDPVTEADFAARLAAGRFCLHWSAHGLRYGIPAEVRDQVGAGRHLLVNLSRRALAEAHALFPSLAVLNVTARPETLAMRLAGRGRETPEGVAARLARADLPLPGGIAILTIPNDGPLEDTVDLARAALTDDPARAQSLAGDPLDG